MTNSVDVFLNNLEKMIVSTGVSNRQIAGKTGISDRMIGMYRNRESVPSLDNAESIAKSFGFELWQFQMIDFDPNIMKNGRFSRITKAFIVGDDKGREVMETAAEYVLSRGESPKNDPDSPNSRSSASR